MRGKYIQLSDKHVYLRAFIHTYICMYVRLVDEVVCLLALAGKVVGRYGEMVNARNVLIAGIK